MLRSACARFARASTQVAEGEIAPGARCFAAQAKLSEATSNSAFSNITVRQVMKDKMEDGAPSAGLFWVQPQAMVYEAIEKMANANVGSILVMKSGEPHKSQVRADRPDTRPSLTLELAAAPARCATRRHREPVRDALKSVQVEGIITERDYLRKVVVAGKSSKEMACSALMTSTQSILTLTPEDTVAKVRLRAWACAVAAARSGGLDRCRVLRAFVMLTGTGLCNPVRASRQPEHHQFR